MPFGRDGNHPSMPAFVSNPVVPFAAEHPELESGRLVVTRSGMVPQKTGRGYPPAHQTTVAASRPPLLSTTNHLPNSTRPDVLETLPLFLGCLGTQQLVQDLVELLPRELHGGRNRCTEPLLGLIEFPITRHHADHLLQHHDPLAV